MTLKFSDGRLLGWLATIVAVAAVAISICLHPPSEMRARRLDEVRMQSLYQTETAVQLYYATHHILPAELNALDSADNHHAEVRWHDPETRQPFEYAVTGEKTYRLCAIFARNSDQSDSFIGLDGTHSRGRDCFQKRVTVDGASGGS